MPLTSARRRYFCAGLVLLTSCQCVLGFRCLADAQEQVPSSSLMHEQTCDASAAVPVGDALLLVANDEDNVLRLYRRDVAGGPICELDVSEFLGIDKEADIEGAAWSGNHVLWIGSHNTGSRSRRHQLFATEILVADGDFQITPIGRSYRGLLNDMLSDDRLDDLNFEAASRIEPKEAGGLNIEGLAATPAGELLIGFRNPIRDGKAIVLAVKNVAGVINGAERAEFRKPILLDLDGLGIRSIDYWPAKNEYLLIAGPFDTGRGSHLFRWSGDRSDDPEEICKLESTWNPESLLLFPGRSDRVLVLSDDGADIIGDLACKDLSIDRRQFRSGWLKLPE